METKFAPMEEKLRLEKVLLENMKQKAAKLRQVLERTNDHWAYEDGLYRFYHQSFKVYGLQGHAAEMVDALRALAPEGRPMTEYFLGIIEVGMGWKFTYDVNERWVAETAPIVQAFLHARYFVEMAVKYAELAEPPQPMPSGWAALLCLFDLR